MNKIDDNPILTKEQKIFLTQFAKWEGSSGFYLTGGTALSAFYLQHRFSEDLDFFTEGELRTEPLMALLRTLPSMEDFSLERKFDRRIFLIRFHQGESVRVEFAPYPFKRIGFPLFVQSIQVDSWEDILCNKLVALADRKDLKDYVDIFFIMKEHILFPLDEAVKKTEQKFGMKGIRYILQGRFLECPKDIKGLRLLRPVDGNEMVSFFGELGKAMVRKSLDGGEAL